MLTSFEPEKMFVTGEFIRRLFDATYNVQIQSAIFEASKHNDSSN